MIKQLCILCGYDLNPPNPTGSMDATKPLIQVTDFGFLLFLLR